MWVEHILLEMSSMPAVSVGRVKKVELGTPGKVA